MNLHTRVCFIITIAVLTGCGSSRTVLTQKKISPQALQEDYSLMRNVLEESHPGLYWFTSKDSMQELFNQQYASLKDSMSVLQFRYFVAHTLSYIHCAHTHCSVGGSSLRDRFRSGSTGSPFPFQMIAIGDTLVTARVADSSVNADFIRGTIIKSINGYNGKTIIDTLQKYLYTDGYNKTGLQQIFNQPNVAISYFHNILNNNDSILNVNFINRLGEESTASFNLREFSRKRSTDTTAPQPKAKKDPSEVRLNRYRSVQIDTSLSSAYLTLNSFSKSARLPRFFKKTFKTIKKHNIQHLVIDIRSNTGGAVSNTTKLLSYVKDEPFVLADSVYTISRKSSYGKYITNNFKSDLIAFFSTKKRDERYHFKYFEDHVFKLNKKLHYKGNIYIATSGLSFSASSIFSKHLKGQSNVTVVGEETGGGSYGNTAFLSYKLILPNSRLRVNVPLYRMVMMGEFVMQGRGVQPDVNIPLTLNSFRMQKDAVVDYLRNHIKAAKSE